MTEEAQEQEYQEYEQESQAESKAREQGWMPYDEWVNQGGDPDQWKPADRFVQDGEQILGILKERNEALQTELKQLRQDFQQFRKQQQEQMTKREQQAYNQAIKDLQKKQEQAVEEGDTQKFREVEQQKEQMQKEMNQMQQQESGNESEQDPSQDPSWQQWVSENPWYNNNSEMAATAEGIANALSRQNPNLTGKPFLDEVTKRIKQIYPDQFENPKRDRAPSVEGETGNKSGGSKKKKTFNDLPQDAKDACKRMVDKQKLFNSYQEYVDEYFAGEE